MSYEMKITKTETNVNYREELTAYNKRNLYNRPFEERHPEEKIVKDVLICELTENQFKAIKAAVLKEFE